MKNSFICLFIAVLFTSANCFVGNPSVTIFANDDPQACLLTLNYNVTAGAVNFIETISNPNSDCAYHNLTFVSWFYNYPASGSIDLLNPNNITNDSTKWVGQLTLAVLQAQNGSACVNAQPFGSSAWAIYVCRFSYGYKLINFFLAVNPANNQFVDFGNPFLPQYGATVIVPQNNTNVWKVGNSTYAQLVGALYNQCGGWSTSVSSGNNEVFLTGTQYVSNPINLNNAFNGMLLFSAIIRPFGAAQNAYTTSWINNQAFNNAPVSGSCQDLLKKYQDIVPSLSACKNGCSLTIYMQTAGSGVNVHVLQTTGFSYSGARLRA